MKKIYFTLFFSFWFWVADAQPAIQWQKSLGGTNDDIAYSIQQTTDGGYIIAGYSQSNNGDVTGNHGAFDYLIMKLKNNGTIQWQNLLGGSAWDYAQSICQTTDGGYIVVGHSSSSDGDVIGNHGGLDYWILKIFDYPLFWTNL